MINVTSCVQSVLHLQPHTLEYSDVIFMQMDQHLKKLLQKYKVVPIL